MSDPTKGVLAIVLTCALWGLSGIYFHELRDVPPIEVLAHRVVWSAVFFGIWFAWKGRLGEVPHILRDRRNFAILALSSVLVSINWLAYIWAVTSGYATEASFGYYIFPLAAVAIGYFAFGERFSIAGKIAICLSGAAVLGLAIGQGTLPLIALFLASTFAIYSTVKKLVVVGPAMSVAVEVLLLVPIAVGFLAVVHLGGGGVFGRSAWESWLLPLSVMNTAVPLILFSYASRRLSLATLGILQYVNPTLQFGVAVLYLAEPFGTGHLIAFGLIWAGVAVYSVDLMRQERAARNAATT